jgi:hypothetical protein
VIGRREVPGPGQSPAPVAGDGIKALIPYALLVLASPATGAAWLLGALVRGVPNYRRWWLLVPAGVELAVLAKWPGLSTMLTLHFWLLHRIVAWGAGGPPVPWLIGLAKTVPLGVPVGLALAAIGPGQPSHPRGPEVDAGGPAPRELARATRKARRVGRDPELPALAISVGGDLDTWRTRRRLVVMPPRAAGLPRLVLGAPGGGKSVYLAREAFIAGLTGRRLIVLDGKGDRQFADEVAGAYLTARPGASVHRFPDEPLDGWRGGPQAQVNRLMGLWPWSVEADYYRELMLLLLRLACGAPDAPISSIPELVGRLDAGELARLWSAHPREAALVKSLRDKLADVQIRVANLAAAIGASLDGARALGDADLTVVSVPTMALAGDAEALFRLAMADLAHWTAARKDQREPALIMVDEFSAITGGRREAIHLVERGRSAGVPVLLAAQSRRSLGEEAEAERLIGAAHALVLFATSEPEQVLKLAGSVRTLEYAFQVDQGEVTGRATATWRTRAKVDANRVRGYRPGQAVILSRGHAEEVFVIPAPAPLRTPLQLEAPNHA